MTNPHAATGTDIDIRASADRVIAQLQQGRQAEALRLLEQERRGEPQAVQEALDRYVAAGARDELAGLRWAGLPEHAVALDRLQEALAAPRLPAFSRSTDPNVPNELGTLSEAQQFDVYASIVEARGNRAAFDALRRDNHSVLLGLRQENSTLVSEDGRLRGTGVYDDHLVVLHRNADGARSLYIAELANTEPTAQYDHHAGSNGRRLFADSLRPAPAREASVGFEHVLAPRKIEGRDADADGTRDLGRLQPGTIEMIGARHGGDRHRSFRPSAAAVAEGQDMVRRDTNADGYFTTADLNGLEALNNTFKIHRGGGDNTYSAGCQTLHPDRFDEFMRVAYANPGQQRWQYVLTDTTTGLFRDVRAEVLGADAPPRAVPDPPRRDAGDGQPPAQPPPRPPQPEAGGRPEASHVPRTAEEDYLERFLAASERGDREARAAMTREYGQQPHVQAMDRQARDGLAAEHRQAMEATHQDVAWSERQRMPEQPVMVRG
ncbi:hypothetical protein [Pseudoxanthomonas sp.]|uniref:hypothetical protein n=1 Tax=Pseudoxanthomonas sp. TaxID=1871049 RepID=UPI002E147127|nr:hypothetical protein [Pseudoxanthomonas sp.]